ncbi:MAG: hypothetical protein HYU35_00990 [Parcubacteria group bacterium]|nr:hypothetical protein [Parcubacteria group bacterium]
MRNPLILVLSILAFLSLALLGGRFPSAENTYPLARRMDGQASLQLATPYASGQHLASRTQDNAIQLSGDYLWRFVYAWDGATWQQYDLGQLLGLSVDTVPGTLDQADNRYIIAGQGFRPSFTLPHNATHLAFYSANLTNNNWCGGCDEEGNRGEWQVINIANVAAAAASFAQSAVLSPFGDVTPHTLLLGDTFLDAGSRVTLTQNNTTVQWVVRDSNAVNHFIAVGSDGKWTNWLSLTTTTQSDPTAPAQRITLPLNNIPTGTYQLAVASCATGATPVQGNCTILQARNATAPTIVVPSASAKQQAAAAVPIPPAFTYIADQGQLERSFFALGKHATGVQAAFRNNTMVFHTILNDPNPGVIDHFEVSLDGQTWTPFRLNNRPGSGPVLPECRIKTYGDFGFFRTLDAGSPNPCYEWSPNWPNGTPLYERVAGLFGTTRESVPDFHRRTRRLSVYFSTASLASPSGFASYSLALRSCNSAGCSEGRTFPFFSILSDQTEPVIIIEPIEAFTGEQSVSTVTRTQNLPAIPLPATGSTIATGPCTIFAGYDSCPARVTWSTPQSTARLFVKRPSQDEYQLAAQGPGGTQLFTGDQVFDVAARRTALPFGILTIVTDKPVFTLATPSGAQLANGEVNVSYSTDPPQPFTNCLPLPAPATDQWTQEYNNGLPFCPEGVAAPEETTGTQASAVSGAIKTEHAQNPGVQIPANASFEACQGSLRCGILRTFGGNEQNGTLPPGLLPYNQQLRFVGDRYFIDSDEYENDLSSLYQLRSSFEFLRSVPYTPGFSDTQIFVALDQEGGRRVLEEESRIREMTRDYIEKGYIEIKPGENPESVTSDTLDLLSVSPGITLVDNDPTPFIFISIESPGSLSFSSIYSILPHEMAHALELSNRDIAEFPFLGFGYDSLNSESDMLLRPGAGGGAVQRAANIVYSLSQVRTAASTIAFSLGTEQIPPSSLTGFPEGVEFGGDTHSDRARYALMVPAEFVAVTAEELFSHPPASSHRIPTPIGMLREHFVSELFGGADGPLADYNIFSTEFRVSTPEEEYSLDVVRQFLKSDGTLKSDGVLVQRLIQAQANFISDAQFLRAPDDNFEEIGFSGDREFTAGLRPTPPDAFEHMADFVGGGGLTDDEQNFFDVGGGFNVPPADSRVSYYRTMTYKFVFSLHRELAREAFLGI